MAKSITKFYKDVMYALSSDEVLVWIARISTDETSGGSPILPIPIRLVADTVDLVRDDLPDVAVTYSAMEFEVTAPDQSADDPISFAQLVVQNVDRGLMVSARTANNPLDVDVKLVVQSDPDTSVMELGAFKWRNIQYDAELIVGDLTVEEIDTHVFPPRLYNLQDFPALF
jgi:hypothetical protein